MKKSKFSESQIVSILNQAESGVPIPVYAANTGLAKAHFINGGLNMAAWMPQP
jgi:hypothetical protein